MRVAGIHRTSLVDNVGVNYVIYAQGCPHGCAGCHNPSTHDPFGGYEVSIEDLKNDIAANELVTGVTFSGGEPVNQFLDVQRLAMWAKSMGLQTTLYTGYRLHPWETKKYYWSMDYDVRSVGHKDDLQFFDYIIDGPFDITKKSIDCPFRGSTNQRILVKGKDY